jgi:hypothetical protein
MLRMTKIGSIWLSSSTVRLKKSESVVSFIIELGAF